MQYSTYNRVDLSQGYELAQVPFISLLFWDDSIGGHKLSSCVSHFPFTCEWCKYPWNGSRIFFLLRTLLRNPWSYIASSSVYSSQNKVNFSICVEVLIDPC